METKKKLIKTRYNTRIDYINRIRAAVMIFHEIIIGIISEESNDAGEFDWVIHVLWNQWAKAGGPQVAGIDMDLRLHEYVRSYIPAFIEERTLPDTRDGLYEELERLGMSSNDRFEFMCRTHGLCGCNNITVERLADIVLEQPIKYGNQAEADSIYEKLIQSLAANL